MQTWRLRSVLPMVVASTALMGCQDNRTTALEKRVADLESRVKLAEEKQAANAETVTQQEVAFKNCLTQANEDFLAAVRNNGTKNRFGYAVDVRVQSILESAKQHKIEECKLLYR